MTVGFDKGVATIALSPEDVRAAAMTVFIGRNGSGKSTLLRETAQAFRSVLSRTHGGGGRPLRPRLLRELDVAANGVAGTLPAWIEKDTGSSEGLLDYWNLMPSRLIALSFTPFDKFTARDDIEEGRQAQERHHRRAPDGWMPTELEVPSLPPPVQAPFYVYLGHKNEGRKPLKNRLLSIVDQLAERGTDARVAASFAAIGFAPQIAIGYQLTSDFLRTLRNRDRASEDRLTRERLNVFDDSGLERDFSLRPQEEVMITADFAHGGDAQADTDRMRLRELVRLNAIKVSSVTVQDKDTGERKDLLELSSGELNLINGFLGLAFYIAHGALVLIDEPENSLHPAWQLRYVEMLQAFVEQHADCHYVVATHSPLILAGAAEHGATIVRLGPDGAENLSDNMAGQSPDATLVMAFDVVTSHNNYLRQLVLKAMTLVRQSQLNTEEAIAVAQALRQLLPKIPEHDEIKDVVAALVIRMLRQ